MTDQTAARARLLETHKRRLVEAIEYRDQHDGREDSPGEISELRAAIRYMTEES